MRAEFEASFLPDVLRDQCCPSRACISAAKTGRRCFLPPLYLWSPNPSSIHLSRLPSSIHPPLRHQRLLIGPLMLRKPAAAQVHHIRPLARILAARRARTRHRLPLLLADTVARHHRQWHRTRCDSMMPPSRCLKRMLDKLGHDTCAEDVALAQRLVLHLRRGDGVAQVVVLQTCRGGRVE
jgi:hypothetical protein